MADEATTRRPARAASRAILAGFISDAVPIVSSAILFVAGAAMLLLSAAPRLLESRVVAYAVAPLPVIEASHFMMSVIGVLMLLVASGLRQRLRSALLAALVLLGAGAAFSAVSGRHYAHALGMVAVMAALAGARSAFQRAAAPQGAALAPTFVGAAALVVAGVAWLGFFSFRHVQYRDELWWTFAQDAEASRFLRSLVTAVVVLVLAATWRLARIGRAPPPEPRSPDLDARIAAVIAAGDSVTPDANLAYLDDKRFLFSPSGASFVMYGVRGRNWIAVGPPQGMRAEFADLAFAFKGLADRHGGCAVFYGFAEEFLPAALDLGLIVQKIGESALVMLSDFSLEGGRRAKLRQARRNVEKAGAHFEVLPAQSVPDEIGALEEVSNSWLAAHRGEEKRFTLGRFDPAYLARFPAAALRRNGRIVAFANLWTAPRARALSIDLMRYSVDAPHGAMDALFVELMLWGKAQGYVSLDLGMAPLAGLEARPLAPALTRLGALVFERGEALYGFEGLRQYKDKFAPVWRPVYLGAPSRLDAAVALADVALLTSAGARGLLGSPRRAQRPRQP